jgi:HEAT repeat protein
LRSDARNRHRIRLYQDWEDRLSAYLFGEDPDPAAFGALAQRDRPWLRAFLYRYRGILGGDDSERLRMLYHHYRLGADIGKRLASSEAQVRAKAALEVARYRLQDKYPVLVRMLEDPAPFVAHAAARSLGKSGDVSYAPWVLAWVLRQEEYQQDRLLEILGNFGIAVLRWMETSLRPLPVDHLGWRLYALVAGDLKDQACLTTLFELLKSGDAEIRIPAMKALGAIGDPRAVAPLWAFASSTHMGTRIQAAKNLGLLGDPSALLVLKRLMEDPGYEVRREASLALAQFGPKGEEILRGLALDATLDAFARDMARERLEWLECRGRA